MHVGRYNFLNLYNIYTETFIQFYIFKDSDGRQSFDNIFRYFLCAEIIFFSELSGITAFLF